MPVNQPVPQARVRAALYDPTATPPTLSLVDMPSETLGPGHVRIDVRAVPVSEFWLSLGRGPFVPCWVFAGVVSEVAEDLDTRLVGRRVSVMHRTGGLAESAVVPLDALRGLPDGLGFAEAACSAAGVKASIIAEEVVATLAPLDSRRVAVHHDGTFFASVLAGLLRRAGLEVLGIGTSPCTIDHQRAIRFHDAIDLSVEDLVAGLSRLTGGQGVDVLVDHVGTISLDVAGQVVRPGGTLLRCDPLRQALPAASATAEGRWQELGARTIDFEGLEAAARRVEQIADRANDVLRAVAAGEIEFVIHTVPFDEIHEVLPLLRGGVIAGPVVVVLR